MTPSQLQEIRERCEKATRGEWFVAHYRVFVGVVNAVPVHICTCAHNSSSRTLEAKMNTSFIAKARTDIPDLLAEIDRLNALLKEIASDCQRILEASK